MCAAGEACWNLATFLMENGSVAASISKFPFAIYGSRVPCAPGGPKIGCISHQVNHFMTP